jgi:flagellar assembly factor FliW
MTDGFVVAMSPRISMKTANIIAPINPIVVNGGNKLPGHGALSMSMQTELIPGRLE